MGCCTVGDVREEETCEESERDGDMKCMDGNTHRSLIGSFAAFSRGSFIRVKKRSHSLA